MRWLALVAVLALHVALVPRVADAAPHCDLDEQDRPAPAGRYYDPEEAYAFGQTIQNHVANRDLSGLFGLVHGELDNGPRRAFIRQHAFHDIFPERWRASVLADEPPCHPTGWRGFMLARGLIWFNFDPGSARWHVFAVNDAASEPDELTGADPAWRIDGVVIPPQCFTRLWESGDNFEEFERTFGISDRNDFRTNVGRYLGREIGHLEPLDIEFYWGAGKISLANFPPDCADADGLSPEHRNAAPVVEDDRVSSTRCDADDVCTEFEYRRLATVSLAECRRLAPHMPGRCESAYLVRAGDYSGGTIGWNMQFNLYGLFALDDGRRALVPLVIFHTRNEALNFIDEIAAGR